MRVRWRRCANLAVCLCCLPFALRLLLLGRSRTEEPVLLKAEDTRSAKEETTSNLNGFAGAYITGLKSANVSYCRWQYGLPQNLTYVKQQLTDSPETSEGLYKVRPFVAYGNSGALPPVTLCSHASVDQVYGIVELARRWEGPLSFAVFAPGQDARLAIQLLKRACHCEPAMARVSVHLVFLRDRPAQYLVPISSSSPMDIDCAALDLQELVISRTERLDAGITYPINVVRNVARSLSPTEHVLVSDVELLPSKNLASQFISMIRSHPPKRDVVFVLPVFEVKANEQPPNNKTQLLAALKAGKAIYFHRFLCPHCQRFPGLSRWILTPDPGNVKPLIITKREHPHNRWEPIFIGTKHDPLYNEKMSWEGRQDKMTQMFEMCLMKYHLIILDGAFLVHSPSIKRWSANDQQSFSKLQRDYERQNARIYHQVTQILLKKYPPNKRCRP